ncbi:MAG: chitobiase/beta-hexosaminidase C-terminal domain-containing protein [Deltaproteobacteria bacterium]|nr:chitobiase/beta-hexosaminidase C-terminal domain-containing protein [Deltaproteobacteria bacterium]
MDLSSFLRKAAFVLLACLSLVGPGHAAERDVTLQWDKSIDDPYLQSYKVYYYTTSGNADSLSPEEYAVSYTLAGGVPVTLSASDPKPITIDKENTQITLRFADNSRDYYFEVAAVDTRSLEGVPTPEIICKTLMVIKKGSRGGRVDSTPAGMHCDSATCTFNLMAATTVTLTAVPDAGHAFTGWSEGVCSGTGSCIVNVTSSMTVTATFQPLLDLVKEGTGTGTVTGAPAGIDSEIDCGTACLSNSVAFALDTAVTLTAVHDAGNIFDRWSGGGCPETGPCIVTMSGPQIVKAKFLPLRRLSVTKAGTGRGNITGAPAGIASEINCGTGCASDSADFAEGTTVTVTAIPDSGYAFTGWSGEVPPECTGAITACVLPMNAARSVTATFASSRTLSVAKAGTGTGSVTSSPAGIACGADCTEAYSQGTGVRLTAAPDAGNTFSGWSGACTGTEFCDLVMSVNRSVTATFTQETLILTAAAPGGNGTIAPAGATTANPGADQTYTITPNAGYHIVDVTVDGVSVGAVTSYTFTAVTASHTIVATFAVDTYALTATAGPNGTVAPAGVTTVNHGASQSYTITANTGHHIVDVAVDGASAGAVGTYTFNSVAASHTIAATFAVNTYALTATAGPNGTVTPAGVTTVNHGASQSYTITANTGHHIVDVTVDGSSVGAVTAYTFNSVAASHTIAATFAVNTYALGVSRSGTGTGLVSSSPAGISCGTDCSETYNHGTEVTLTATADASSAFTGWSGACTGTASTCTLSMDAAKSVTAAFADIGKPTGSISYAGGAYTGAGTVTLTLSASDAAGVTAMSFSWDGGTSWSPEEPYGTTTSWNLGTVDGLKTAYVKFKDGAGNWSDPFRLDLTLDTTGSALTVGSFGSCTNNPALMISGTASDALSGLKGVTVNGTAAAVSSGSFTRQLTLASGDNTIVIVAEDNAGNATTVNRFITLDQTSPALMVTTPAEQGSIDAVTGAATINIQGTVDEGTVTIGVNGYAPEAAPVSANAFSYPVTLADGPNVITVTAMDCAGNVTTATRTVVYDKEKPILSVTEPAGDTSTNQASMIIRGTVTDMTGITLMIDVEGTLYPVTVNSGSFEQTIAFAVQKSYQIVVSAADETGHTSTVIRNIVYDLTKPALVIHPVVSPTNQSSQTLSGDKEALVTIAVSCPTATVGAVAYPTPTTWSVPLTGLSAGVNAVTVTGTDEAANQSLLTAEITLDTAAPVTTLAINGGGFRTNSAAVTLTLTASVDAAAMQFKNEAGAWSTPETYSTTKAWILSAGDGTKTVSALVRDTAGNWSAPASAAITLDTAAPAATVVVNGGASRTNSASVTLTLTASADTAAMQFKNEAGVWSTPETYSTTKAWILSADDGTKTVSALVRDTAGHWSAPASAAITLDTAAPAATVVVNGGASRTNSATVTLTLASSADAAAMQFKNEAGTWSTPETYSTTKTWTLSAGDGTKTVSAQVRDTAGNWSALASAAITLDTTAPAITIAIDGGASRSKSRSVTLNIAASADATMMQFKNETGAWTTSEAFSASKSWTLTAGDGTKTVSAKVRDAAGNWSAPSDATIALDTVAPVTTTSPAAGFIGKREAISLISSEAATIHYTLDGSTPHTGSTVYSGAILLAADATVKFFAQDLAGNQEAVRSAAYRIALPGDVNLSSKVDIADAILAVQLLSRMSPAGTVSYKADADGDGKIGLPDVLYILQKAAGLR